MVTPPRGINVDHKHKQWLLQLTALPTASGCEAAVVDWVKRWARRRPTVDIQTDRFGNVLLKRRQRPTIPNPRRGSKRANQATITPIYFTAHMDHPAFVVTKILTNRRVQAQFRGGVLDRFFTGSKVLLHTDAGPPEAAQRGTVRELIQPKAKEKDKRAIVEFRKPTPAVAGQIITWDTGLCRIKGDRLFAPACDDLAGVAAALSAFDALGRRGPDVRVLLTRAEEVGFVGAIGACRSGIIPPQASIIALECSKSFAQSPIGAGPIVRVGDRTSTFDPGLTYRLSAIAHRLASAEPSFRWQRHLMPGGTCEATAYCAYGYTATCLCLPLGNYHNMDETTNRISPETISLADYHALIRLLIEIGATLNQPKPAPNLRGKLESIFTTRCGLLK